MISKRDLQDAQARIAPFIHKTPILSSGYINKLLEAEVFFKAECFQKTGSFKARGATNAVLKLSEERAKAGVATHSSGNHGQALAWAAERQGIPAYIVMPENAPKVKVAAVRSYNAQVDFCAPNLAARETGLAKVQQETGASFVPPYNHISTIEGQASCALEIFEEHKNIDVLLVPVGGGGLLAGSALSAHHYSAATQVIGCEPHQANDAYLSFQTRKLQPSENPNTIADGLRTSLGDITFRYILELVSDIITCQENTIVEAMRLIWERMKIVVEPSGAVPLACVLENPEIFKGKRVAIILSGGNVDLAQLPFQKA